MSFQVNVTGEETSTKVQLMDNESGCIAEVYTFGALLNSFSVPVNGERLNVIDGFNSIEEARSQLTPMFKSAKLSPFVCRVKNGHYKFADSAYHLSKYFLKTSAIHGLVFDAPFSVVDQTSNDNEACVKLQYVYDNDNEGYPFHYRCEVEYRLSANNSLTVSTTITNIDEQLMPVADGWHPYFTLGDKVDDYQVEFQSKEMLEFDKDLIPTGKTVPYQEFSSLKNFGNTVFDNCFTLNFAECQPMAVVRNPKRNVQVEIYPTNSYPYLQIYTPENRRSIAIENLSGAPDAFNNGIGLKVLEPNEASTFTTKFVIHPL
jgi:aldose 1-epimerase